MTFVLVAVVLLAAGVSTAHVLRCSFETALPTALFAITLVLYGFGLFDLLAPGFVVAVTLLVLGVLATATRLIRSTGLLSELRRLATPGVALFGAFFVVTFFVTRRMELHSWDEFSHWGTVVRATYVHDALGPYNPVDLIFPDYPPVVGLFQYFVMKLGGGWLEGNLFWGYQLLFGSLFLPFTTRISWRPLGRLWLVALLVVATPILFFPAFEVILADPVLGFLFGYVLALAYTGDVGDWRFGVHFAFGLATLTLAKDSGFFFALLALALYLTRLAVERRRLEPPLNWGQVWARLALPMGTALVARYSWAALLLVRDIPKSFAQPIGIGDLVRVLLGGGTEVQGRVMGAFGRALVDRPLTTNHVDLHHVHWLVITVTFAVMLERVVAHRWPHRLRWAAPIILAVGAVMYTAALLVNYLFRFTDYEASGLASYERYLSTYWAGIAIFFTLSFIWLLAQRTDFPSLAVSWSVLDPADERDPAREQGMRTVSLVTAVASVWLVVLLFLAPIGVFRTLLLHPTERSEWARAPLRPLLALVQESGIGAGDRVWIIDEHTTGFNYHILRYSLIDSYVHPGLGWSLGAPKDDGDVWTVNLSVEEFSADLADYDYLLVYSTNDSFASPYRALFANPDDLEDNTIFEIVQESGRVTLVKIAG